MAITLYSEAAPELRLGPGPETYDAPEVIRFRNGFATIEDDDPKKEEKLGWVNRAGELVEILGSDEANRTLPTDPSGFMCGVKLPDGKTCEKSFDSEKARRMHRMHHAPKKG